MNSNPDQPTENELREIVRDELEQMLDEQDEEDEEPTYSRRQVAKALGLAGTAGLAGAGGMNAVTDSATADSSQAGDWGTANNPGDFYSDDHFSNDHASGGLSTPPTGFVNWGFEGGAPYFVDDSGTTHPLNAFADNDGDGTYTLPSTTDGISVASTDTDTLVGADIANAATDYVPTAQGDGTLAMQPSSGIWTKDTTASISGDTSVTLSTSYSQVKILIQEATHDNEIALRCNSYSTSTYDTAFVDGTTTTDWNQLQVNPATTNGNTTAGIVEVYSTAAGMVFTPTVSSNFGQSGVAAAGWNGDTTGSISSVQLRFPNDTTTGGTVEVFGR